MPLLTIPTLAGVAYAFWKDLSPKFTIALMIGQVLESSHLWFKQARRKP